tara:strand:- start:234 stop:428 length:195 start_codon:yes stop_codon:yes gene_type:complete
VEVLDVMVVLVVVVIIINRQEVQELQIKAMLEVLALTMAGAAVEVPEPSELIPRDLLVVMEVPV